MEKLWASFKFEPSIYQSRFHRFVIEKIVNRFLVDQSQKELSLLNQQINRTPIQYQAQALTDIQPGYGGGINITPKYPNSAVCQKNGFGYPTLYINQNPYYRPN